MKSAMHGLLIGAWHSLPLSDIGYAILLSNHPVCFSPDETPGT